MKQKLSILLFLFFLFQQYLTGQQPTYTVKKAAFSSDEYDEYSPVYYKNGIVFTSNRSSGSFVDYSSATGKTTFDIMYVDTTAKVTWRKAKVFSKYLKTPFNEGPVTFTRTGDTVYYSRNMQVEGNVSDLSSVRNKLGIFSAVWDGKKWTNIREFRYNSEWYNISTPCLSPDGRRIYYASDRPGGQGGSDLYYSQLSNGFWGEPVNLGPVVNTSGNESYPFMNEAGELFFSSDGHPTMGGKDIFVTRLTSAGWHKPVRMEPPVNSTFDDFGIVTDALISEGYISSNREVTVDIYKFNSPFFSYLFTVPQVENQYCLVMSDDREMEVDTLRLEYVWDFGGNKKIAGSTAEHCYDGPGRYIINLDIVDIRTGNIFMRKLGYDIDLADIEQPVINSPFVAMTEQRLEIDGLRSYCPAYEIAGYFWDMGDGTRMTGEKVNHSYTKSGEYEIRLGLKVRNRSTGLYERRSSSARIWVFQTEKDRDAFLAGSMLKKNVYQEPEKATNVMIRDHYSASSEVEKEAMFNVVIMSSREKLSLSNNLFRNVPAKYRVNEFFNAEAGMHEYVIDQQMKLMECYPAWNEMLTQGYREAQVRPWVLAEPAEKELYQIRKNYSLLTDSHFDISNRLTTSAYVMLDQVVMLMNKYPLVKLEVGVHTDNQGRAVNNQTVSQLRAQVIVNYLVNRGINSARLTPAGYGQTRPVAANTYPTERRLNRRIEFVIL
ncbi:MAG TPA: PKD domain-containing protein [Bacteroidales bacterium]|nr:PKD domain-containing protein [Bacteroidales bacterium]